LLRSSLGALKPAQSATLGDPIVWAERIAGLARSLAARCTALRVAAPPAQWHTTERQEHRGDDLTATEDPFKVAMRQIAGVFAQLEKSRLVAKLRAARQRKRQREGKCEGRKSHVEKRPEVVALARRLRRASPKTGKRRSLREVSAELAHAGYSNERGRPYAAQSIKGMLGQKPVDEGERHLGPDDEARSGSYRPSSPRFSERERTLQHELGPLSPREPS
jgi:hypothetical protein